MNAESVDTILNTITEEERASLKAEFAPKQKILKYEETQYDRDHARLLKEQEERKNLSADELHKRAYKVTKARKSTPHIIFSEILKAEGGYQDDIEDTGNYTKKDGVRLGTMRGITPKTYAEYIQKNIEDITVDEMKSINENTARKIYENQYLNKPKFNKLPSNIKANVIDMGVNAGPKNAIKILQKLIGLDKKDIDGILGDKTLNKLNSMSITSKKYSEARINYYKNIIKNNASKKKYLKGWIKRANKYK